MLSRLLLFMEGLVPCYLCFLTINTRIYVLIDIITRILLTSLNYLNLA